jgi:hypothetical protein
MIASEAGGRLFGAQQISVKSLSAKTANTFPGRRRQLVAFRRGATADADQADWQGHIIAET